MRERLARWIAAWTGVLVVMLSGAFAVVQNPAAEERPGIEAGSDRMAQAPPAVPPGSGDGSAPTPASAPASQPEAGGAEAVDLVPPSAPAASAEVMEAGRRLFAEQTCGRCHSIAGKGNPRTPLDGIAAGRSDEDIRHWIVGDEAVREEMSPRAFAAKQRYASLSAEQLAALVAYLKSLPPR
jgi:mono/diheme cytochrome c family protein